MYSDNCVTDYVIVSCGYLFSTNVGEIVTAEITQN